jgi:hypothetical protein
VEHLSPNLPGLTDFLGSLACFWIAVLVWHRFVRLAAAIATLKYLGDSMPSKKGKIQVSTLPTDPIGFLPDGTINIVSLDDPPFRPTIIDSQSEEPDPGVIHVVKLASDK